MKVGEVTAKEKNDDLLSKIFKLIFGKPKSDATEELEIGERTKTLQNLEFAIEKIANVFQVRELSHQKKPLWNKANIIPRKKNKFDLFKNFLMNLAVDRNSFRVL